MPKLSSKLVTALVLASSSMGLAADTASECRGVAAGVVAALRASGDIQGDEQVAAAILAAQRSCEAVLMNVGTDSGDATQPRTLQKTGGDANEDGSFWDFFGSDDDEDEDPDGPNPGIERLKRLRN